MIRDLLQNQSIGHRVGSTNSSSAQKTNQNQLQQRQQQNLKIREHPTTGPYVEGLSFFHVASYNDVKLLLEEGLKTRTVAATNMNSSSSRSHCIFTLEVSQILTEFSENDSVISETSNSKKAKISLIDLAGSERADSAGTTGIRLQEGSNINKSLTTLGRCISTLAKISLKKANSPDSHTSEDYIPFRDSNLTWLLRDNLWGNAKTAMIANISPAGVNHDETLSTLRYAASAKQVSTIARVNEDETAIIISRLKAEIEELKAKLSLGTANQAEMREAQAALDHQTSETLGIEDLVSRRKKQVTAYTFGKLEGDGRTTPHLRNVTNDPSLSGSLRIFIPLGSVLRIGAGNQSTDLNSVQDTTEEEMDLYLDGLGMAEEHCTVIHEEKGGEVFIKACSYDGDVYVNGKKLRQGRKVKLSHGDRVILGVCSHLFVFVHPLEARARVFESGSVFDDQDDESEPELPIFKKRFSSFTYRAFAGDLSVLPTYEKMVREVLIGREENAEERAMRLLRICVGKWRESLTRRIFEDQIMHSIQAIFEANQISKDMNASDISFQVFLSGKLFPEQIFSINLYQLLRYENIIIRIACNQKQQPLKEHRSSIQNETKKAADEEVKSQEYEVTIFEVEWSYFCDIFLPQLRNVHDFAKKKKPGKTK